MAIGYKLRHRFINAFRELFVYHNSSLEFRARVFALLIAVNEDADECPFELVQEAGMQIYNEEDRANTLTLTTKEFVESIQKTRQLDIDMLVNEIVQELKIIPRYARKIDIAQLEPILNCSHDDDTLTYQKNILGFLSRLKQEYESKTKDDTARDHTPPPATW